MRLHTNQREPNPNPNYAGFFSHMFSNLEEENSDSFNKNPLDPEMNWEPTNSLGYDRGVNWENMEGERIALGRERENRGRTRQWNAGARVSPIISLEGVYREGQCSSGKGGLRHKSREVRGQVGGVTCSSKGSRWKLDQPWVVSSSTKSLACSAVITSM